MTYRQGRDELPASLGHSWHPHETRHTVVSVLSHNGVKIQDITDAVGHDNTRVTESVYRHVIAPEVRGGADVMNKIFGGPPKEA